MYIHGFQQLCSSRTSRWIKAIADGFYTMRGPLILPGLPVYRVQVALPNESNTVLASKSPWAWESSYRWLSPCIYSPMDLESLVMNIQSIPPGHDARIDKVALVSICLGCGWISHHALVEYRNLMDGINMDPYCTYWPPSHQWDQNQRWNHGCQRSQDPRPPKLTHFPIHRRLHIQSDLASIARLQHTIKTTNKNSNRHTHTRQLNLPNKVI